MTNPLVLAYLGDAIYELYIRKYLIEKGLVKVNNLQSESIKYVSAKNQAKYLFLLIDNNFFNEEELDIIKKARNHKVNHKPKNCDIITYKNSTSFEAVIGYLYQKNNIEKIESIIDFITNKNKA